MKTHPYEIKKYIVYRQRNRADVKTLKHKPLVLNCLPYTGTAIVSGTSMKTDRLCILKPKEWLVLSNIELLVIRWAILKTGGLWGVSESTFLI